MYNAGDAMSKYSNSIMYGIRIDKSEPGISLNE